jgi:glycosyltransferase involved in cell wall biosynthesis
MPVSRSRLKLVAIGFNTHGTGLTRVMHSIMRRLADAHEIHYLGIGYSGETVRDRGLAVYPTNLHGGDVHAAFQAKRVIEEIAPDIVFILHDIWYFGHYLRTLGPYRERLKLVCYLPLDGRIADEDDAAPFANADRVVVYTDFARKEFEGAFDRLRAKQGGEFPPVAVIPHGVDRSRFHPLPALSQAAFASPGRVEAKQKVFAGLQDAENSFIVLNASRPNKRKRIDLTIEGFALFAAGKSANVRLCLHHALMIEQEREQVHTLIERFKLQERVHLNPLGESVVEDAALNLLYNACDVGLLTSMGEGWGLVSFEHGAAGAAQIVPDHSACAEIWNGRAEMIPLARRYIPKFSTLEMGEVSADGVAQALDNLYRDPQRRQQLAQAAFKAAQNPAYAWDAVAQRFGDLFAELAR